MSYTSWDSKLDLLEDPPREDSESGSEAAREEGEDEVESCA